LWHCRQIDQPFSRACIFEGAFAADVDHSVKQRCLDIAMQESPKGDAVLGALGIVDQREKIVKIPCPFLVLHRAEDGVVPIGIGEVAASLLQKSEMKVVPVAALLLFLKTSRRYNRHLVSFLKRRNE
jgi:pimeloyl-ACP methyl ester carboxylesterase